MRRVTLFLICCMLLTSVTAFAIGEKPTPTPTPAAQSQTNIFPTTSDGVCIFWEYFPTQMRILRSVLPNP